MYSNSANYASYDIAGWTVIPYSLVWPESFGHMRLSCAYYIVASQSGCNQ